MKKILRKLQTIENAVMIITFSVMVITSFIQVLNRNFTQFAMPWLEEAAVYCMIYMVLIGTEIGLRDGTQIAVTSFVDKLGGKGRKVMSIISKAIVVVFSATILIGSIRIVGLQLDTHQTSPALGLPMGVPYFALVLSFAIITVVQFTALVSLIIHGNENFNKEEGK